MLAAQPGALCITWESWLPSPSWVMPRWTETPSGEDIAELRSVIRRGEKGFREIATDLCRVDIEGRGEFGVTHVVPSQPGMHQAGDESGSHGRPYIANALDQRRGAVAYANDGHTNGCHRVPPFSRVMGGVKTSASAPESKHSMLREDVKARATNMARRDRSAVTMNSIDRTKQKINPTLGFQVVKTSC